MSDPVRFLTAFSQALATLGLYGDEHPATIRACETAYRHLTDLQGASGKLEFTFLPGEVLFGRDLLPDLEGWEWSPRFSQGAMERLEVSGPVEPDHFEREQRPFFERVRAAYLALAEQYPERIKIVDAAMPLPQVQRQIEAEVAALVERFGSTKR